MAVHSTNAQSLTSVERLTNGSHIIIFPRPRIAEPEVNTCPGRSSARASRRSAGHLLDITPVTIQIILKRGSCDRSKAVKQDSAARW